MPKVKPDILRWARETAHFSLEGAAKKLGLGSHKNATPVDRMLKLESGDEVPSRPLLLKMAKHYRRPLLAFYLSKPPRKADRGQDFRTLPDSPSPMSDVLLDSLIRDIHTRQGLIRVVLEDDEEVQPLSFVGSVTMSDGPQKVVSAIQSTLKIDLIEYRAQNSVDEAFKMLRSRTEAVGIFVLLMGNLGTHHTNISLETFRGYALADDIAPFVVINEHDSHGAWPFTLIHELAHIWLGLTGVSGLDIEHSIEKFCNEVAGEFLLPKGELADLAVSDETFLEDAQSLISDFALHRNISSTMVAYRLYLEGRIGWTQWSKLNEAFRALWISHRHKQKERSKDQGGGPSYYIVRAHRVGSNLIGTVGRLMAAGSLTTSKAGKVLGVNAKNVKRLVDTVSAAPL
ncbi:ImmA/IrrE family metallo-endopeptidase [Thermodesulfobacteriota bacterium]